MKELLEVRPDGMFSRTDRILYNIFVVLEEILARTNGKPNLDGMNRAQLLAELRKLPNGSVEGKPSSWNADKLRSELNKYYQNTSE